MEWQMMDSWWIQVLRIKSGYINILPTACFKCHYIQNWLTLIYNSWLKGTRFMLFFLFQFLGMEHSRYFPYDVLYINTFSTTKSYMDYFFNLIQKPSYI